MELFAGIDGGQTATQAVVADALGNILGRGTSGPADEVGQTRDSTRLRDALEGALADALAHAQISSDTSLRVVVAGISGFDASPIGAPPRFHADRIVLVHDAPIAHYGAFDGGPGIIVIAGTGSVAYAVGPSGESAVAGGYGYLFGDEGGAFGIARDALKRAMRGESVGLRDAALGFFARESLHAIARDFYAGIIDRANVAAFAPTALTFPAVLDEAVEALAEIAEQAKRRVRGEMLPVALIGGVFTNAVLKERLRERIGRMQGLTLAEPLYPPVIGALRMALKA